MRLNVNLGTPGEGRAGIMYSTGTRTQADVQEGDFIEIGMLGAYGVAMSTGFNGYGEHDLAIVEDAPMASLYGLAPQHTHRAAHPFVLAVYRDLLADVAPQQVTLAGDSAGGGLALAASLVLTPRLLRQLGSASRSRRGTALVRPR